MLPNNVIPLGRWLGILALVLTLGACGTVQVTEVPLTAGGEHQISSAVDGQFVNILGVDFDPPLDYLDDLRVQGVTLLVALENRGSQPVRDVRVVARLHVGGSQKRVIERTGVVPELVPGQVTVYRFPRVKSLPLRRVYRLHIQVLTADGRQVLNQRTYTLRVSR